MISLPVKSSREGFDALPVNSSDKGNTTQSNDPSFQNPSRGLFDVQSLMSLSLLLLQFIWPSAETKKIPDN
ncbi:hypothetical protein EV13_2268 [Prochlorococcus sp. MIT 0702]|nr:hypothetical protein EV13_2268 [Prochlorococcus sp. MIT 0702]KGG27191.1 hypothetical protein EV12_1330 [Prochlorococcus sp. MIT 0701]